MQHRFEDGVYDIQNDLYHGSYGLSRSALCEFKKSPWHYWHKYLSASNENGRACAYACARATTFL
jgi:hypothetical protein